MRFAFGKDWWEHGRKGTGRGQGGVRESVRSSRAKRKVIFAKAETKGMRRRATEGKLLWEGRITTISYFPGFYTPTQLINPHTNPLRRISPMVFYFSRKKWAPGGWLRGRKLPPRETPHAQAGIISTVSLQLTSLRLRSCWPHSVKMHVIWEKSHWQGDQVEREILREKILPSVVQKIMLLWKPFLEWLNNQRITREIYFYFVG